MGFGFRSCCSWMATFVFFCTAPPLPVYVSELMYLLPRGRKEGVAVFWLSPHGSSSACMCRFVQKPGAFLKEIAQLRSQNARGGALFLQWTHYFKTFLYTRLCFLIQNQVRGLARQSERTFFVIKQHKNKP